MSGHQFDRPAQDFHGILGTLQGTEHGRFVDHHINIVQIDRQHPITRNMRHFQADDELYTCLVGERPVHVLATARSKVTGKDHPMAFVFNYGKGRVFHTPLGHDVKAIQMPGVAEITRRGCIWAAGREK